MCARVCSNHKMLAVRNANKCNFKRLDTALRDYHMYSFNFCKSQLSPNLSKCSCTSIEASLDGCAFQRTKKATVIHKYFEFPELWAVHEYFSFELIAVTIERYHRIHRISAVHDYS